MMSTFPTAVLRRPRDDEKALLGALVLVVTTIGPPALAEASLAAVLTLAAVLVAAASFHRAREPRLEDATPEDFVEPGSTEPFRPDSQEGERAA